MSKNLWIAILVLFFTGVRTEAGVLFEPYAGYSVGNVSYKYLTTVSTPALQGYTDSATANGFTYGGRVGLVLHHYAILAGEYQVIDAKLKFDKSVTDLNAKETTTFLVAGFQMPLGLRMLVGYGIDARADMDTAPNKTLYKGTAYKITLGWIVPAGFALNLEHTIFKYTSATSAGVSTTLSDTYSKFDASSTMVNVSFPFTFLHGGSGHAANNARNN